MINNEFRYELIHQSKKSQARVGRIHTQHGVIDTPAFVPVGTHAALKAVDSRMVADLGVSLMFCNTYHLLIQPGSNVIHEAGGLHTFMNHSGPLITDSGGFQVFSLAYGSVHHELKSKGKKQHQGSVIKIKEEGVLFRSYRDGLSIMLTPESSIQAQKDLGADIIVSFDELPAYHISPDKLKASLERTHRWEKRSLDEHKKNEKGQALYAVIHGGIDKGLREKSCRYLTSLPFDGYAIGGSLGRNRAEMLGVLDVVMPLLPQEKPRHLLGIGDLESMKQIIPHGVDTFDSSYPTRAARHGILFTNQGYIRILQGVQAQCFEPIEYDCPCFTCAHYTRAYLHHLFKAHELTAFTLASIHNVAFMVRSAEHYRLLICNNEM